MIGYRFKTATIRRNVTFLDHLAEAKALIEGVAAAGGLVTALIQAAEVVRNVF
jgi:hypothetical protein